MASRSIQYVHTSDIEKHTDAFTFSVSDGTNEVSLSTVFCLSQSRLLILQDVMGLSFPLACLQETVTRSKGDETSHVWACRLAMVGALTSPAARDLRYHRGGSKRWEGKPPEM